MSGASCSFLEQCLSIVVVGASGDLAKKKTYPSLFALFGADLLHCDVLICGFARTKMSTEEFRDHIRKALKGRGDEKNIEAFLKMCIYTPGNYGDTEAMQRTVAELEKHEGESKSSVANRLYYFAIPPSVFVPTGNAIKAVGMTSKGWTRVVIEKPFGKDLTSFEELSKDVSEIFTEEEIYRIDHYLGKEMAQNLATLRFANMFVEPIWNRNYVSCVTISFKEDFGTDGRGGYFDSYGIIRDVMQNHLIQIMSLFAMEAPPQFFGNDDSVADFIRTEKVKVLRSIAPIRDDEVVLGQYIGDGKGNRGYTEDETVPDGSTTPTFATIVFRINNPRWEGVPFVMRAGKALNEKKAEIRMQLRNPPAACTLFNTTTMVAPNEFVMRLNPDEAIYMKTNVKKPGLTSEFVTTELNLSYKNRFPDNYASLPDAYTRLILDVLRGDHTSFVRDDELRESWKLFTPLLNKVDDNQFDLTKYKFGTRGPQQSDELIRRVGFRYPGTYLWDGK